MIYIGPNSDSSGVIHTRKFPHGTPEKTDKTYTVKPRGHVFEVHCLTRSHGRVTGDDLVTSCNSEQEADAVAAGLANPEYARNRGRRILDELMEDE